MKTRSMALAMVLSLVVGASVSLAQTAAPATPDAPAAPAAAAMPARPMGGTITKVDGTKITYTPMAARGRRGGGGGGAAPAPTPPTTTPAADVTIDTNDKTNVTINGEKKAVSDLTVGQRIRVTLDADGKTATDITVAPPRGGRGGGGGGAPAAPATPPAQ